MPEISLGVERRFDGAPVMGLGLRLREQLEVDLVKGFAVDST